MAEFLFELVFNVIAGLLEFVFGSSGPIPGPAALSWASLSCSSAFSSGGRFVEARSSGFYGRLRCRAHIREQVKCVLQRISRKDAKTQREVQTTLPRTRVRSSDL